MPILRYIVFLLFLSFGQCDLIAQEWYVGVKGGPSWSMINAESIMNEKSRSAYHIGLFANKYLNQRLFLSAEINYIALGGQHDRSTGQNANAITRWKYEINYISLPIAINYQPHKLLTLGTGIYSAFLVGFNVSREAAFSNTLETPSKSNLKSEDFGYHFQLSLNLLNISLGLTYMKSLNELPDSRLTDLLISKARNSAVQISVGYRIFGKGKHLP